MTAPRIPDAKIAAWISLLRTEQRLLRAVEAALKAAGLPQLTWYDVLLELKRADGQGLRPMDLEGRLLLPQYGLSRLLDRMEKAGLISRAKAPEDGRGHFVRITPAGREMQAAMWPVYASAVDAAFASRLTTADARTLGRILAKLSAG